MKPLTPELAAVALDDDAAAMLADTELLLLDEVELLPPPTTGVTRAEAAGVATDAVPVV